MSTQKGNIKKGSQKYQNTYKFKHNKNSVKTDKIKSSPLDKLCARCHDIIQWKIDYRKYKPLTAACKCNICQQRTIIKAYRTICDDCALHSQPDARLCTKCGVNTLAVDIETGEAGEGYAEVEISRKTRTEERDKLEQEMDEVLKKLRERCKRTVLRKIETGEVTFDPKRKIFIYKDTEEEYKVGGGDSDEDDDNDDDMSGDSDEEAQKKEAPAKEKKGASKEEKEKKEADQLSEEEQGDKKKASNESDDDGFVDDDSDDDDDDGEEKKKVASKKDKKATGKKGQL